MRRSKSVPRPNKKSGTSGSGPGRVCLEDMTGHIKMASVRSPNDTEAISSAEDRDEELDQLASAALTAAFSAVLLITGHLYLESRSRMPVSPTPTMLKVSLR
jgi:hypothetical protein